VFFVKLTQMDTKPQGATPCFNVGPVACEADDDDKAEAMRLRIGKNIPK